MDIQQLTAEKLTDEQAILPLAPARPRSKVARRALDVGGAGLLLIVFAPALLVIAVAIRLDSGGGAIYRQRRLGRGMAPFVVHKFRSMRSGADPARHREYVQGLITRKRTEPNRNGSRNGNLYKLTVDDRITRVGRFLRRYSLDELPQLWDVLRGDMSLVGPRPVIPYEAELYPPWYEERFAVKPGLTGLWQVKGRNERTYEEMVRLDLEYVRRNSLLLDLGILAKTPWVVVRGRGAA